MRKLKDSLKLSIQTKIILGLVLIGLLLTVFLTKFFISVFLIFFAILLSYVVRVLNIKVIGIELTTFTIVIFGYVFGLWVGGIFGLILILMYIIVSESFGTYVAWIIPEYTIAGVVAAFYNSIPIATLGTYIVGTIATVNALLTFLFYRFNFGKYLVFAISNVAFNIFLFTMFGETVVGLLS